MKKLFIILTALSLISCHNKHEKTYDVTLIVTGNGTYNYQIGEEKHSGVCESQETFSGTVKAGDLVEIDAIADVPSNDMTVELESNPVLGDKNLSQSGPGIVQVQYLVK